MKYKLTRKLFIYFFLILIFFALVVTFLFITTGQKTMDNQYAAYLETKIESVSRTLTDNLDLLEEPSSFSGRSIILNPNQIMKRQGGRRYITIINEILASNVLILDSKGYDTLGINSQELPKDFNINTLNNILNDVFSGHTIVYTVSNGFISNETLVAAAPVFDGNNRVKYAAIIYDTPTGRYNIFYEALRILLIALLVSILLLTLVAVYFANKFVKPVIKLDNMAKDMINDDYSVRSNIKQNDEIGDLSHNMDSLALRLEEAKRNLDNLESMRKDFISSLSHELKTPVTVLRGSLESIRDGVINPIDSKENYIMLLNEVITLERLIKDLMELTGLQNPNFPVVKSEVYVNDIIRDSIRGMRSISKDKDVLIEFNSKDIIKTYDADYTRLKQLFTILLDNAVKFSKSGSKVIVSESENPYEVRISNNGEALTEEEIKDLFKPFYRKDNNFEGKGLGLSIAKEIAKRHDLDINVTSKDGINTFSVVFPIL